MDKKVVEMNHIKRTERKLMYTGSMLSMYSDTIVTPDGNTAKWDYIEHSGAAAVVPVLGDGRILLVRQYRNALDRETLEIPAGGINKGEESLLAAARELEEETGYKSDNLTHLISLVTAVAFCDEVIQIYVADNLQKTQQHLDQDEYIEVEAYTMQDIADMIYSGKIQDSKTIAAIMAYINKK